MKDEERAALSTVADVLVQIRQLARRGGAVEDIAALADSVHNTPRLIAEGDPSLVWLVAQEQERAKSLLRSMA